MTIILIVALIVILAVVARVLWAVNKELDGLRPGGVGMILNANALHIPLADQSVQCVDHFAAVLGRCGIMAYRRSARPRTHAGGVRRQHGRRVPRGVAGAAGRWDVWLNLGDSYQHCDLSGTAPGLQRQ